MARRRVTYVEVADERPGRPGTASVVDLDPRRRATSDDDRPPPRRDRPSCPAWLAQLGVAALVAVGALLAHFTTGPDERAAIERSQDSRRPDVAGPDVRPVATRSGPIVIPTSSIVGAPWRGVFEHHPDARGASPVARVHVITLAGPAGRGLLVVDATRRAFGGPEHPADGARAERALGPDAGDGLRTLQWDAAGYGLSLATVGLDPVTQRAVVDAVRLPDGPSLLHGRSPGFDARALRDVGLEVIQASGGAASAFGSPLIGQAGGSSIEGQLHREGRSTLLVSVVQDQLADASWLRGALGPAVAIELDDLPGITTAAAFDHGPAGRTERRIRGWARLVLDHAAGATIELSSDVLRPAELLDAARQMDLGRLARTTAALPAGGG